ncbi:MAG TPA: acetylglutamate kinase [Campylobacterales bacterium]|nr:acetylglutamate kinase [Campylobacterales bacterium]
MQEKIQIVKTIIDAFPFIQQFSGKTVVIKYGGAAQTEAALKQKFARDIALMFIVGIKVVIVHGGGKKINTILDKLEIETEFIDGQRVTSAENMEVVEMVLSGSVNKEITALLNHNGAKAIGLSGKDASFMRAKPKDSEKFGFTGTITSIDSSVIQRLIDDKFIPVIAPIAAGDDITHPGYNINADLAASKIAIALKAEKIIFLTDTAGVLDKDMQLLSTLKEEEIQSLIKDETISSGMIPKVSACLESIDGGVEKAHIIDGRIEHSLLLELFTSEGIGTVIKK